MKIQIKQYCRIVPDKVLLNGEIVFESADKCMEINDFLSDIYYWIGINYRKFFKMDTLSKAGFVVSELLLQAFDREQAKEDMGIVFFNQSGSLEADRLYQQTIQDQNNYFPSPAVFVYTLPNIVNGEVAIRNKIHGETAFFILPLFQSALIEETVKGIFYNSGLKHLLTGWIDIDNDEIDVCMMLCVAGEEGRIEFNAENIEKIYNESLNEQFKQMDELIVELKKEIIKVLNLEGMTPDDISDDGELFGQGLGLDSIDALELIVLLEKNYGIKLKDPTQGKEIFKSVRVMAEFIHANRTK